MCVVHIILEDGRERGKGQYYDTDMYSVQGTPITLYTGRASEGFR